MPPDTPPAVETVIVRAPRLPPSPADAAFSIIELPPEALRTATRLDDALELVPGFSLYRRVSSLGANPTTQGVSLRGIAGSAASRALVTLDGVPQNDPFGGWVIFTSLPPETIGAANVVLGAGSGPYGAGALTGVVSLETPPPRAGEWLVDGQAGALEWERGAGTGTVALGDTLATFSAAGESSNGWDPIRAGRGPADTSLTLSDWTASGRFQRDFGPAVAALRLSAYQEDRSAGTLYAGSRARGGEISLTAEADPAPSQWGWRGQLWALASDLANTSASVSVNQQTASLADNEFQTPALGLGANAEARRVWSNATLEVGADARADGGEDRETFDNIGGVLTRLRRAGGESFVGGVYAEGTERSGPLLFAADARLDDWQTFDGHDIESPATVPSDGVETRYDARGGVLPSGRAGIRYDLDGSEWLRTAVYAGFRPPTLNELFRSFRVGNNVTKANPALVPERLYGAEGGAGGSRGPFNWSVTVFYNRLDDPVTNVTLRDGPYTDPIAGFVPVGGALLERENVGSVNAYGVEGQAQLRLSARLSLQTAFDWTHARVDGGAAAADLDGLQPAETPTTVATGFVNWNPVRRLRIVGGLRHEGRRFVDDQNQLPLAAATVVDMRIEYAASARLTVFIAADNLFDAAVEQNESITGLYSFGPPRIVSAGFRLAASP
jgi:outer membrane receptor protein involved in Fe transport